MTSGWCGALCLQLTRLTAVDLTRRQDGTLCETADRPRSPMAEAADLKSAQCRFESDRGHRNAGP
jgi:hypothetical protein